MSLTFYQSSYRLSENLAEENDAFSTLEEIKTAYLASEEEQGKENCPSEEQIGRIIRQIFPDVTRKQRTVIVSGSKKRLWGYSLGLQKVKRASHITKKELDVKHISSLAKHCLVNHDGWRAGSDTSRYVQLLYDKNVWRNEESVAIVLQLFGDSQYEISLNHGKVPAALLKKYYFMPTTVESLANLLKILSKLTLCRGFPVKNEKSSLNREGIIMGKACRWRDDCGPPELRHHSVKCWGLVSFPNTLTNDKMCKECSKVKINCQHKLKTENDVHKKPHKNHRESYMTAEEKDQKLTNLIHELSKKKRKLSYYKEKINKFEVELDNTTSNDMENIFSGIKLDDVPDQMKIFWEGQKKALQCKGKTGYRWDTRSVLIKCMS